MIPFGFGFDPIYLIIMGIGMAMVAIPQWWVKKTYKQFSEVPSSSTKTGAEVARDILRNNRINDVEVEMVGGFLSDHYDPGARKIRLSQHNYEGRSIAGIAVAAHEVGHAIQHATGYAPIAIRSALAPVFGLGSRFGPMLIMIGLALGMGQAILPDWALMISWLGVLLFSAATAFHFVTLPVEFNASARALTILNSGHYLNSQEMGGAKKVLTAAAMTYLAAALYSLIQLLYWVMRIMGRSGSRD